MKAQDLFIYGTPTLSRSWDMDASELIIDTFYRLKDLGLRKGRMHGLSTKHGIDRARNDILRVIREGLDSEGIEHGNVIRMLWYDVDVLPVNTDPDKLAEMIRTADENHWNLLGHYWQWDQDKHTASSTFNKTFVGEDGEHYYNLWSPQELAALKPYQELPDTVGGLGFYYGDMPLDWHFQFHGEDGEDTRFFIESKLPLRWFPVNLLHLKAMPI